MKIAIVGKGGTGKTAITTLMAKIISEEYNQKLLLIDADPTHPHLSYSVDLVPDKSLEDIRIDIIRNTMKKSKELVEIAKDVDFELYNSIAENKKFSLLRMGRPETPGCFCPSNSILKKVIESISKDYDIILIDCEAGLEQINRMVLRKVDCLLILSDISLRSIDTALSIQKTAKKFIDYKKIGLLLNKVRDDITIILNRIKELNLPLLGEIPEDEIILDYDLKGIPLIKIPERSKSYNKVKEIVKKILN